MLRLVTASNTSVLTLQEVKNHLRVDDTSDDTVITSLISVATSYFDGRDGILGRCLTQQTWEYTSSGFEDAIQLPLPPTVSVSSVKYLDASNTLQTLDPSLYQVVQGGWEGSQVIPAYNTVWPSTVGGRDDAVRVEFIAGYSTTPEAIKHAMLLLISDWYDVRDNSVNMTVNEMPFAVRALIAPFRVVPVA